MSSRVTRSAYLARLVPVALLVFGVAACDGPMDPVIDEGGTLTVDASSTTNWALVDLGTTTTVRAAPDPASSTDWDLGFQTTKVTVNGGTMGTAGMVVHCLCENAGATAAEIMAMTPESELAAFEGVTADQIPGPGAAWAADTFDQSRWYRYNLDGNHQVWPTYDVYLVKRGDEVYKVQVTGYYGADGSPRQITFRYARLT